MMHGTTDMTQSALRVADAAPGHGWLAILPEAEFESIGDRTRPGGEPFPDLPEAVRRGSGSVTFEHVGKTYRSSAGTVQALSDISLEIPAGSIFGIIGRSGAGKSSLLRIINRLERPDSGRALVDGEDIGLLDAAQLLALRRRIGMIFQHFNLLSAKTVFDNVALPLRVAGVPQAQIRRRVTELLILRPDVPRSLRACCDEIRAILPQIEARGGAEDAGRTAKQSAGRLALRLEYAAVDEILEQGLHPWLTGFRQDSARLSLDIQQAYFEAQ